MNIYFIYMTHNSIKKAKLLSKKLVKKKFAACVNIYPVIYSIYEWKNKTHIDKECSIIIKTSKSKVQKTINFIKNNHSYGCPSISAFPIKKTHKDFEKWVINQSK